MSDKKTVDLMYRFALIQDLPPLGKFVALYDDGSGADLFFIDHNGDLYDASGQDCEPEILDDFTYWIPVPDDYKFWCERD